MNTGDDMKLGGEKMINFVQSGMKEIFQRKEQVKVRDPNGNRATGMSDRKGGDQEGRKKE